MGEASGRERNHGHAGWGVCEIDEEACKGESDVWTRSDIDINECCNNR